MIKIENIDVWGFEHAIRGMRNPYDSWMKSDSKYDLVNDKLEFVIGRNDLELMRKLYKAGSEHRKYLRQIMLSLDVTAPFYWWKEFDTYKVGIVANSCSTMHTIAAKGFHTDDFSTEHLEPIAFATLDDVCDTLNYYRRLYLETNDKAEKKKFWWNLIQLLPSSYNQKRTITMNYENVVSIIKQREGHKLDEWHVLIEQFLNLPYIKEITRGYDSEVYE